MQDMKTPKTVGKGIKLVAGQPMAQVVWRVFGQKKILALHCSMQCADAKPLRPQGQEYACVYLQALSFQSKHCLSQTWLQRPMPGECPWEGCYLVQRPLRAECPT